MKTGFAFFVFVLMMCFPDNVFAEKSAKRLLFDDCEEARAALPRIPPDQVEDFISYLGRVLTLPTGSTSELLREPELLGLVPTPLQRPAGQPPIDELKGVSISRTLEPERELEGKRCAGKLLLEFGDKALRLLPSLAVLLQDKTLSDDIRNGISADLKNLVLKAKERNSTVLAESAAPLFQLALQGLGSEESKEVGEILLSMGDAVEPYLIDQLFSKDERRAAAADALLERTDKKNWKYLETFRVELNQADAGIRDRVLTNIEKWKRVPREILSDLLKNLLRSESTSNAPTLALIEKILRQEEAAFIPEDGFFGVLYGVSIQFRVHAVTLFEATMRSLQPFFGDVWGAYFETLLGIRNVSQRILFQGMGLSDFMAEVERSIGKTGRDLLPEFIPVYQLLHVSRAELFKFCTEEIRSLSQPVRTSAFECIGGYPVNNAEVEKALLQFLKSPSEKLNEARRREGILSVIDVLGRIQVTAVQKAFMPYVQEAMFWPPLPDREKLMRGSGVPQSRKPLGWESLAHLAPEGFLTQAGKILATGGEAEVLRVLAFLESTAAKIPKKDREPLKRQIESAKTRFVGSSQVESASASSLAAWEKLPS